MAATRNVLRTAALAAFTLYTAFFAFECGLIHQMLIEDHMEMNHASGWSFWAMTVGGYASVAVVIAASYFLWRGQHPKAAQIALTGVGSFMGLMIVLYFYVHATDLWLPFGIEHEPMEDPGTLAVMTEVASILGALAIMFVANLRPAQVGDNRDSELQSTRAPV